MPLPASEGKLHLKTRHCKDASSLITRGKTYTLHDAARPPSKPPQDRGPDFCHQPVGRVCLHQQALKPRSLPEGAFTSRSSNRGLCRRAQCSNRAPQKYTRFLRQPAGRICLHQQALKPRSLPEGTLSRSSNRGLCWRARCSKGPSAAETKTGGPGPGEPPL